MQRQQLQRINTDHRHECAVWLLGKGLELTCGWLTMLEVSAWPKLKWKERGLRRQKFIDKSLSALGDVIASLASETPTSHIGCTLASSEINICSMTLLKYQGNHIKEVGDNEAPRKKCTSVVFPNSGRSGSRE